MQIFSGTSNQELAVRLAKLLNISLGSVNISRFANDEVRVWVTESKVDKEVIVVQSLSTPTDHHLIEFLMLIDALRRKGAKEITAVIPYMGYTKQDKVFRDGESLSVKVIAQMLQIMPLSRIITFDLHNPAILGFYEVPVSNLSAGSFFDKYFSSKDLSDAIVVAPDAGAVKKSSRFAEIHNLEIVYMDKKRDLNTGKVLVKGITGSVENKNTIIIDDMVATGSTLIESSKYLHEKGARSVTIAATHYLAVPGVSEKIIGSDIDEIIITNTVNFELPKSKFHQLDITPLIATTLS